MSKTKVTVSSQQPSEIGKSGENKVAMAVDGEVGGRSQVTAAQASSTKKTTANPYGVARKRTYSLTKRIHGNQIIEKSLSHR